MDIRLQLGIVERITVSGFESHYNSISAGIIELI